MSSLSPFLPYASLGNHKSTLVSTPLPLLDMPYKWNQTPIWAKDEMPWAPVAFACTTASLGLFWDQRPFCWVIASPPSHIVLVGVLTNKSHLHAHHPVVAWMSVPSTTDIYKLEFCNQCEVIRGQGFWGWLGCKTQEMWVQSLGQEDPLEKEMATPSNILAWRISWTEERVGL